jgi:hypothetical protein
VVLVFYAFRQVFGLLLLGLLTGARAWRVGARGLRLALR